MVSGTSNLWIHATTIATLTACFGPGPVAPAQPGTAQAELTELPPVTTDNQALLIVDAPFRLNTSSTYQGWPATNATDGDLQTSWYSGTNDSAARGKAPYFEVEFEVPTTVQRVTILGNRDPAFLRGYTIHSGRLELRDAAGSSLAALTDAGTGNRRDFDFRLARPVADVKTVRFTSVSDEGDKNIYGDVAIAEFQVE